MSYGEGDLHARVEELEDELSEAQGTIENFACENVELRERIAVLETLARDMAEALRGICREGWTINQTHVSGLLARAGELGILGNEEPN